MSAVTIQAGKRLAGAAKVTAATDVKGAIAHVKSVLGKYELGLKSVKAPDDDDWMRIICKGPEGLVVFALNLDGKKVHVDVLDDEGLRPAPPQLEGYLDDSMVTLKKSKDPLKSLKKTLKAYASAESDARDYAEALAACSAWVEQFGKAMDELRSSMD